MNDALTDVFTHFYGIERLLEDLSIDYTKIGKDELLTKCPFHDDSTPSFSINKANGLWVCFSCDEAGNLTKFVQLTYHIDYKTAREFLETKAGISDKANFADMAFLREIDSTLHPYIDEEKKSSSMVTKQMVGRMYERDDPHKYLLGRGFSPESISYFECGYTSDYHGKGKGTQERITLPGHDKNGELIGFIGRTPTNQKPKYLYTFSYPKAINLFNLHRAKKFSDKGLILTEGPLDTLRIHDLGFPNVCAVLGARLSAGQLKLLLEYTDKVYLMFDNDTAGEIAKNLASEMTWKILQTYIVPLGQHKDPGEIVTTEELTALLQQAKRIF